MSDLPQVTIYTDGACAATGPRKLCGGWANIILWRKSDTEVLEAVRTGRDYPSTNSRMETFALLDGLRSLNRPCQVHFYSDSQQLVDGMEKWIKRWIANGWKNYIHKPIANQDLWRQIADLRKTHQISGTWVEAHVGPHYPGRNIHHDYNERCDFLAVGEAMKMKSELEEK